MADDDRPSIEESILRAATEVGRHGGTPSHIFATEETIARLRRELAPGVERRPGMEVLRYSGMEVVPNPHMSPDQVALITPEQWRLASPTSGSLLRGLKAMPPVYVEPTVEEAEAVRLLTWAIAGDEESKLVAMDWCLERDIGDWDHRLRPVRYFTTKVVCPGCAGRGVRMPHCNREWVHPDSERDEWQRYEYDDEDDIYIHPGDAVEGPLQPFPCERCEQTGSVEFRSTWAGRRLWDHRMRELYRESALEEVVFGQSAMLQVPGRNARITGFNAEAGEVEVDHAFYDEPGPPAPRAQPTARRQCQTRNPLGSFMRDRQRGRRGGRRGRD